MILNILRSIQSIGCMNVDGVQQSLHSYYVEIVAICFENSKYISEKEYDNLGGWDVLWDILKKALKKKSLKNFYQTSVGFCLVWEQEQTEFLKKEGETEVHISVWKYYVGKAASQRPADEKFDLKYDETSLGEFVVKLRQIMEEMYEKYHM